MSKFEGEHRILEPFTDQEIVRLIKTKARIRRGEFTDFTPEAKRLEFGKFLCRTGRCGDFPSGQQQGRATAPQGKVTRSSDLVKELEEKMAKEGEEKLTRIRERLRKEKGMSQHDDIGRGNYD